MDVSYSAFHSRAVAEPFQRLVARTHRRALIEMELDFGFYGASEAAHTVWTPSSTACHRRQWGSVESITSQEDNVENSTRVVTC
jgi:hypothetical protein